MLVSIDTLRGDRLGVNGNTDGLTPNLDRLASEGTTFTHAYSQSTHTGPSHLSLFSGRYPTEVDGLGEGATLPSLAQVLRLYGYQTAARTAGGDLTAEVGPTSGFDSYVSGAHFSSLWHTAPMGIQWIDGVDPDRPFFLFVHGYDTHTTYLKPPPFGLAHTAPAPLSERQEMVAHSSEHVFDGRLVRDLERVNKTMRMTFRPRSDEGRAALARLIEESEPDAPTISPEEGELVRDLYDGGVSWADAQVGLLMAALEQRGHLDDTVLVVIGDHGEALGEDGLYHRCCGMHDGLVHVPLVVRLPGGAKGGQRVDAIVELLDVMPTLLELAGATPPAGIRGASLVSALGGGGGAGSDSLEGLRPHAFSLAGNLWSILSVRGPSGRLTYSGVPVGAPDLPEVLASASLPGPAFTSTLPPAEEGPARAALVEWVRELEHRAPEEPAKSDELQDALKAHGYWEAKPGEAEGAP